MKRMIAVFTLMIPAAPSPCSTRAAVRLGSDHDNAHSSEANVNTTSPAQYTRRNPTISPNAPNGSNVATTASW